jgi:hypothetical protein
LRIEADDVRSRTEAGELRSRMDGIEEKVRIEAEELRAKIEGVEENVTIGAEEFGSKIEAIEQAVIPATVWAEILLRSNWSALTPISAEPTISILLVTRNRAPLLRRAVESVLAQTYRRWELVVVNDSSTDETKLVIEAVQDRRVRLIDSDGSGAAHALNLGLSEASGSVVAFLDDDNLMAPGWLRAVAVALQERPELSAVYGAQLRSSERHVPAEAFLLFVSPFDWGRLVQGNFIDIGVVAHRNALQGLSFDEELGHLYDWDYVVALAHRFGIEPLPVVASFYTTAAPNRASLGSSAQREVAMLRRRFREAYGPRGQSGGPAEHAPAAAESPTNAVQPARSASHEEGRPIGDEL